ncbi:MAG TPA: 30S ribosomal protein S12 methylthiotransferase RimO [Desulfobacteraceae bacterium]|nr:30S ribosomal protein S12 methylthiotransferase RimO [Desulfobacteraceae bacterium]HPJ68119.1 30S ribosomal protein S12 methylthiotransferase RimO [Desulfobacteraceae bacterium]HPQ29144.1 30S ribosomal protein S12 methylthiotransferase RimO [Desulfobacteraceae bacterium]
MNEKDTVFLISLGCAKNLVDSEHMLGMLRTGGFEPVSNIEDAGIALINTCGFIQPAVKEAVDTILEVVDIKKNGRLNKIIVAGCLVQRYGYKLRKEIPEVDGWLGTGEMHRILEVINETKQNPAPFYIGRPEYLVDHSVPRVQTTPFYTAYLRIAEGCSHKCSYCIIPGLRGPFRSRSMESLITETKEMADRGVKEINVIAQDTTRYGSDLKEAITLEDLLEDLVAVDGLKWIRLLYCHPDMISDRLLALMESEERICPYIDLPLQHVNKDILKAMRRNTTGESPYHLIERIRSKRRKISLRTTFMVGFPGETHEAFRELCEFVKAVEFDHLGAFIYSSEKGTRAALLSPEVKKDIAKRRLNKIMKLQEGIAEKLNQRMTGETLPVLIEGFSPETDLLLKGRTSAMAPDIDGQVLINKGNGIEGEIMNVLITEAHAYDLVGELV